MQTRNKIIPYFTIHNAHAFINFMAITFGAKVIRLARHTDGTVQHARLVIDDSIIMLNEASEIIRQILLKCTYTLTQFRKLMKLPSEKNA